MKVAISKPYILAFQLTFLIAMLSSCANQNTSDQNQKDLAKSEDSPIMENVLDTSSQLKFTGAVRSILEDSKGNYWFGSWNKGV
jgi:hypothetical protein